MRCFISLESSHHLPLMAGEGGQVRGLPYKDICLEMLLESVHKQKRGACTHTPHTCTCSHTLHMCTCTHMHTHTPHTRVHMHRHTSIHLTIQSGCRVSLGTSWFAPTFSEAHASWWQFESWYLRSFKKNIFPPKSKKTLVGCHLLQMQPGGKESL